MEKILSEIYYNISNPGSYGGVENLLKEAQKKDQNITRKQVKEWLSGEITYTLHKPVRKRFKRNPIIAENPLENFQADLVDLKEFSKNNDGFSFILTVIDVFTKKAWAEPLKNKSADSVLNGIKKIFQHNKPFKLQTDNGTEFLNKKFKSFMDENKINHFTTKNVMIKCSVIERFNKTLKNKMFKIFTKTGIRRYIDDLQNMLISYNNTFHRSINTFPNNVNSKNSKTIFKNLYGFENKREILRNYKSNNTLNGKTVRIKYDNKPLDRGFYPNWTDNTYTVKKSISHYKQPLYKIVNNKNQILDKSFYIQELQEIAKNDIYRVEKVLKEKFIKKKKFYFVKWLNYPNSENSWISANDLFNLKDGK